jgi:hypothetical protein
MWLTYRKLGLMPAYVPVIAVDVAFAPVTFLDALQHVLDMCNGCISGQRLEGQFHRPI